MKLGLVLLGVAVVASGLLFAQTPARPVNPVTEISADLGTCSAEFHVTDMRGHGIYDAKIRTVIRYGFLSKRKLELEAGTNSDGRARFVKLPDNTKKSIEFTITNGIDRAKRSFNPGTDCHAEYDVPLSTKARVK